MNERFCVCKSAAGVRLIVDRKNGSTVALVLLSDRPEAHTEAMTRVMVQALNVAVTRPAAAQE